MHPFSIERQYRSGLQEFVDRLAQRIEGTVIPFVESLAIESGILKPRIDDWTDSVDRLMASFTLGMDHDFRNMPTLLQDIGQKTAIWNDQQWQKILHSVLGVNAFQSEPWLTESLNSFVKQNTILITSLKQEAIDDVSGILHRGLQSGIRHEEITKQIKALYSEDIVRKLIAEGKKPSKRNLNVRTRLIARDQVSKLNGNLTQLRQVNLGIETYRWRTSRDERVRPSHAAKEGKVFRWDDPPQDTGHPGEDYQCRCSSEPVFSGVYKEIYAGAV